MKQNKHIERDVKVGTQIFDKRSLQVDYRTLKPLLKKGMKILDVGCGTGAISKDMAVIVGDSGSVTGIDNTEKFIESGKNTYQNIKNLNLIHADLFDFETDEKFDLITSARTLQWLSNPKEALLKMKSLLNPGGTISILDYNHEELEWNPAPPQSMQTFYKSFLQWKSDAGMNNRIAEDLPQLMQEIGLVTIEKINSDEHYTRDRIDFESKVGIWSKVANSPQMIAESYLTEALSKKAIQEYNVWIQDKAISMTMKLNEVRGKLN